MPLTLYSRPRAPRAASTILSPNAHPEILLVAGARVTFGDGAQVRAATANITAEESDSWIEPSMVQISWPRPLRTARLFFSRKEVATKVAFSFAIGTYNVDGQRLGIPSSPFQDSTGFFIVDVTGWPFETIDVDVRRSIDRSNWPFKIDIMKLDGPDIDVYNPFLAHERVAELLGSLGAGHELESSPGVGFDDPYIIVRPPAGLAISTFKDSIIHKSQRALSVVELQPAAWIRHEAYKLAGDGYRRCAQALEGKVAGIRPHLQSSIPGLEWLRIQADDIRMLAEARDIISELLAGQVVFDDIDDTQRPLWSPAFALREIQAYLTGKVEKIHDIHCEFDEHTKRVRMHGGLSALCRDDAIQTLNRESKRFSVIDLSSSQASWLLDESNMRSLSNQFLSPKRAIAKLVDRNTKMLIQTPGRTAANDGFLELVASAITSKGLRRNATEAACRTAVHGAVDCVICLNRAARPVKTWACRHTYCNDCFVELCLQSGRSGQVLCCGADGGCNKVLSLGELRTHLSPTVYDKVLLASFTGYVERKPDTYRYCPTPDCGHIYNKTQHPTLHLCQNCFRDTCSACGSYHGPSTPCNTWRQELGFEKAQVTEEIQGIKACPTCKTLVEKDPDDCNHITCRICAKHFCWVCLTPFDSSGAIYKHLDSVHGRRFNHETPFEDHGRRDRRLALQMQALQIGPHAREGHDLADEVDGGDEDVNVDDADDNDALMIRAAQREALVEENLGPWHRDHVRRLYRARIEELERLRNVGRLRAHGEGGGDFQGRQRLHGRPTANAAEMQGDEGGEEERVAG